MPLSRLSARRNRDALVRQRTQDETSKSGSSGTASRHLNLWEAIRNTREELDQWQARVDQVETQFNDLIVPREYRMTDAYCTLTEAVMDQFANTELSSADRSLLGLWTTDNLQSLATHPFVTQTLRSELLTRWSDLISVDGAIEHQLARLARQHALFTADSSGEGDFNNEQSRSADADSSGKGYADNSSDNDVDADDEEDLVFDFGWHQTSAHSGKPSASGADTADNTSAYGTSNSGNSQQSGHENTQHNADQDTDELSRKTVDDTVESLEKKLSIDKLFRQLARVLHPDREQDESLKAEKHVLMSQCLQARQDKDINTLLTLYCEHVGELPDDLTDNSHEELVTALQLQLQHLQQELREKRFGDPILSQIVERYGDRDTAICEKRFAQHAKSLDTEIQQLIRKAKNVQTSDGLQDALLERRDIEQDRVAIDEITGAR